MLQKKKTIVNISHQLLQTPLIFCQRKNKRAEYQIAWIVRQKLNYWRAQVHKGRVYTFKYIRASRNEAWSGTSRGTGQLARPSEVPLEKGVTRVALDSS